jgi:hypothetical protein
MKISLCLMILVWIPLAAFAQKIKVERVKGNKAVVVFSGTTPEVGKSYALEGRSSTASKAASAGSRDRILGFSAGLSNQTVATGSSSSTSTSMSLAVLYGWNLGQIEYGVLGEVANASYSSTSTSVFGGGGFFDYNFVANTVGEVIVYGVGIQAKVLSTNTGVKSYSSWEMDPTGFLKWFAFTPAVCLRFDAGLRYRSDMTTPNATTTSGLMVLAGLGYYF